MTDNPGGVPTNGTPPGPDLERVAAAVRELLAALGEDVDRPELGATPVRSAQSWAELLSGRDADPVAPLIPLPGEESFSGQAVALRNIAFRSVCEHHLLPFDGVIHLMYRPSGAVAGLGSFIRTIEALSSRLQLQERLTEQIADAIEAALAPEGILVVAHARHGCVSDRGVRDVGARTMTIASRGSYSGSAEASAAALLLLPTPSDPPTSPADPSTPPGI
ncbi:GTP cyclohydrolase I [Naasia lichenicola]|uniref:GTP cyclohydrolase 1 n=1 Tax=Naasia lichenicola TaxID=2565933 RepID=A0A4S4FJ54_9MICO|nr:GTP cyclohydrolase I [Naasia lichenicola]THG29924.1 GTP cyclohydrolase I [Naasia lichenicola]